MRGIFSFLKSAMAAFGGRRELRIVDISPDRGVPGAVVTAKVSGEGLRFVSDLSFSGAGVTAEVLRPAGDNAFDVTISVAADAALGPRAVEVEVSRNRKIVSEPAGVLFFVVSPASSQGVVGIGTHLI